MTGPKSASVNVLTNIMSGYQPHGQFSTHILVNIMISLYHGLDHWLGHGGNLYPRDIPMSNLINYFMTDVLQTFPQHQH